MFILIDEDGAEFAIFNNGQLMSHFIKKSKEGENLRKKISFESRRLIVYAETELGLIIESISLFNKVGIEAEIDKLEEDVDLPVNFFSPTENPTLYIALGASYRKFGDSDNIINFVPSGSGGKYNENLILRTVMLWRRLVIAFLFIMIVTFSGFYIYFHGQRQALQRETNNLSVVLDSQKQRSSELIEGVVNFNNLVQIALQASTLRSNLGEKLQIITDEAERQSVQISGIQKASNEKKFIAFIFAPTRSNALQFKNNLELNDAFDEVNIPVTELAPDIDLTLNVEIVLAVEQSIE